ncbi:hypothetical protein PWG14_04545 (plasmid) [Chromobacterium amazonense]|uniref:hypothetical protein n=1 Tax=Chromobacterium amazonense TaxID=1382803 RepID=UPI00237E05B2|nr:hypothetical protein [Chromobacterium amazonense]MDE1712032.1 hypothetical protein [Chromobacterium amazonense]
MSAACGAKPAGCRQNKKNTEPKKTPARWSGQIQPTALRPIERQFSFGGVGGGEVQTADSGGEQSQAEALAREAIVFHCLNPEFITERLSTWQARRCGKVLLRPTEYLRNQCQMVDVLSHQSTLM